MARSPAEQVFNDRYQIVRHIARGGMAEVYLARDLLLDRPVALKVLFPEFAADRSFVERFRREARAAANLNHPNIVSVYDWGEEGGTYFIVMEYVEGHTLRELIRSRRTVSPDDTAEIGAQIAAALGFAHHNGVIHRDVKPGNVIITNDGMVKVTDFGVARAGDPSENLTQTGTVMGTATYFSPEQAQGKQIDARSDVYSLGVVLYEMVTGRPPFRGENPVAIAYQHVREEPDPPSGQNPAVAGAFEAIVLKAMAKDVTERYQSAEDLRADLLRFRERRPVAAETTVVAASVGDSTRVMRRADATQAVAPTAATMAAERSRKTGPYLLVLLGLLALLLVLLALLARALGVGGGSKTFEVPDVRNSGVDAATKTLKDRGLVVKTTMVPGEADPNTVVDQDPKPPAKVKKGDTVTLSVSQGPQKNGVPDVMGFTIGRAEDTLSSKGFTVGRITRQFNSRAPADTVIAQDPAPNAQVNKGTAVNLTVSRGSPTTTSPPTTLAPSTTTPVTAPPTSTPRSSSTSTPSGGDGGGDGAPSPFG